MILSLAYMIRPLLQSSKLARDSTRTELISATSGALATVLTVVVELRGGLTGAGVAEVIVDVPRGGAGECVGGGGAGGTGWGGGSDSPGAPEREDEDGWMP